MRAMIRRRLGADSVVARWFLITAGFGAPLMVSAKRHSRRADGRKPAATRALLTEYIDEGHLRFVMAALRPGSPCSRTAVWAMEEGVWRGAACCRGGSCRWWPSSTRGAFETAAVFADRGTASRRDVALRDRALGGDRPGVASGRCTGSRSPTGERAASAVVRGSRGRRTVRSARERRGGGQVGERSTRWRWRPGQVEAQVDAQVEAQLRGKRRGSGDGPGGGGGRGERAGVDGRRRRSRGPRLGWMVRWWERALGPGVGVRGCGGWGLSCWGSRRRLCLCGVDLGLLLVWPRGPVGMDPLSAKSAVVRGRLLGGVCGERAPGTYRRKTASPGSANTGCSSR